MTHILDLSGANERLFLLRQLVLSSRDYCKRELLYSGDDKHGDGDWGVYWGRLQFLVSKYLLESAISLRILQDTLSKQLTQSVLREMERDFSINSRLGEVLSGTFDLTLRETCNKIVHALEFSLEPSTGRVVKPYSSSTVLLNMSDVPVRPAAARAS